MLSDSDYMDPETLRSLSRQIYGHEMWIDGVGHDGDEIFAYGLYGHKMVPDKPMPTDYANVLLYDDNGRVENPDREIVKHPHGWRFSFKDKGASVYTLYIDSNSTWVTDEEGWHRGVKRDFSDVKYSGAFNMVAKKIISRDGKNPGSVVHCPLEVMPEEATLEVGKTARIKVLYDGAPLPNAKVICFCKATEEIEPMKTDASGILEYPVKEKGEYMFIAKHIDDSKKVDDEFDETSFTTTLTMETR